MQKHLIYKNRRVTWQTHGDLSAALPMVLLHGFCEDAGIWAPLVAPWAGLPLVAIDLPGFGGSESPADPGMSDYAETLVAVLDALSLPKILLVGHSLGGYVALEFAARFPARLAGLCLYHSHPYEDTPERKEGRLRAIEVLRAGKKESFLKQLFPGQFAPSFLQNHPKLLDTLVESGRSYPVEGIVAALTAMMRRREHLDTLRSATFPVQFVLGDEDALIPVAQALKAAVLPAVSKVDLLKGVGHMSMFEAPEKAAEAVRGFHAYVENT